MNDSSSSPRLAVAVAVCISLMGNHRLQAQEAGLPEAVRIGLSRYADLDPLALTCSQNIEAKSLGSEKIAANDLGNFIVASAKVQQIAFREGRIYVRREMKVHPTSAPTIHESAFDGNILYLLGRAEPNSEGLIQKRFPKNDDGYPEGKYYTIDYFLMAGIRVPIRLRELVPSWRPQSELLTMLAEGGQVVATDSANLEGRALIRVQVSAKDWRLTGIKGDLSSLEKQLRLNTSITEKEIQQTLARTRKRQERTAPQRRYDFYLDPECGYAVRRLETRDKAGHLLSRSDCTEHEQLRGRQVWMPRLCRVEHYTYMRLKDEKTLIPYVFDSPLYVHQYKVSAIDVNPWPYERFQLKYTEPGVWVNDGTYPEVKGSGGVYYQIPANPNQLDEVIAKARDKYLGIERAEKQSPTLKAIFLIVNGVALAALAFYLIKRWRTKASSA